MTQERIYIGGLNPPRLTAKDILKRLKSLHTIEIQSSSIADDEESENDYFESGGKPYLHITATSNDESVSALSIVHRHYHNVKWKGCKLVVELAKPHFLERLAQERSDREKRKAEAKEALTATPKEPIILDEPSRIPRRLRVRKKHGDTAVHIDTKPWTVETWSRFQKARTKLKQREEKHYANFIANNNKNTKEESFSPSGPLMHRAVHIRFATDDGSSSVNGNGRARASDEHDNISGVISSDESSTSSSSSSDSDSNSESSRGSVFNKDEESPTKQTSERYEWSDDDSDSDDSETAHTSMKKTVDFDSQDRAEESTKKETYHWSTDEDSDDEDDQENTNSSLPSRDRQQLKPVSGTNEFAAGFDDAADFSNDDDEKSYDFNQATNENSESDLVGDVASNLNILSSIFPDMANTKPMNLDGEDKSEADGEHPFSSSDAKKSNSSLGFMPRFDPSAKSSEKYIVEDEQEEETNPSSEERQDEDAMDEEVGDSDDEKKNKNDTREKLPNVSTVYEQDKLENVFRKARDAWDADENPTTVTASSTNNSAPEAPSENTSTFSFGFKLDDNNSATKESTNETNSGSNAFSFSFNVPEPDIKDAPPTSAGNEDTTMESKDPANVPTRATMSSAHDTDDESDAENAIERHKGLTLPDEDLRKYVDNFFGCNHGVRIMQNPQEFMNDDKERTEWNNERQTLTLDWKRKRKYAITRIQKRMKVRRR